MVACFIDSEPTGQTWNNQFCFNYWWMNLVSFFNSSVSLTCIREIINSEHVLSVRFLVTFVRWFCPHANRFKILLYLRKKWMACVWNWVSEKVSNQYRVRTIRVRLFWGLDARRYNSERLPSNRTMSVTKLVSPSYPVHPHIGSNHFSSERRLSKLYQCATYVAGLIGISNLGLIQTWIWIVMIWKTILKSHSVLNFIKINLSLKENFRKHWPRRDSNPQSSDPKSDAISIRPRGRR